MGIRYAELHCISNFTFLRGASHPEELVKQAATLGYTGLALTDECSVAGVVKAHAAARGSSLKLAIGSEFHCSDGLAVSIITTSRSSYAALCRLITRGRRSAEKGQYRLSAAELADGLQHGECIALWHPGATPDIETGGWLKRHFGGRLWLAVELGLDADPQALLARDRAIARDLGLPALASGNVHMHVRERRALQDTLTAIRLGTPVHRLGCELHPNGERSLRSLAELSALYPQDLLNETMNVLDRVQFSLDELRYEYPRELVPEGQTPAGYLRALTMAGKRRRWPHGAPSKVEGLLEHELELIGELGYEPYFLTVYDLVRFARRCNILCQGRGSAANSAVCYCLGITEVDPARMEMLVERFISKERNEPPDIDVDFEHERREEVIQYIYDKYSRERAALAATVITYRPRSAIRDVGKALGIDELKIDKLAKSIQWWEGRMDAERLAEAGLDLQARTATLWVQLAGELVGFPRHLSQHVGGFVICAGALSELVPIENAAMPERTVIQWDKRDLEELGLMKVDVLGLGMLSAIRRSFELIESFYRRKLAMSDVPAEDPQVYEMISRGDTVGVFQIESRAQMAMLPRLRPSCFYDLVIEIAIIRPGPIQGDMVHPYLRRRDGEEAISYPSEAVEQVLQRTLGVPIFQEQVMKLAMVAAGFSAGEADQLRRAMAAWRRSGDLAGFERRLIGGMLQRGYKEEFARRIFKQIEGFGEYGFPESHAASFALLAYVSAWLKRHEPAAFFCALLNSQPMGFYAPAQLLRAARGQGVEVYPIDVTASGRDSTLEPDAVGAPGLRLGLRLLKGLSSKSAERIVAAREHRSYASVQDLAERAALDSKALGLLAAGGALKSLARHRHKARWAVAGVVKPEGLMRDVRFVEGEPLLRAPTEGENIVADYRYSGVSLERHPLALLRPRLRALGLQSITDVESQRHGTRARVAGLVITRQRPASAAGVTFVTIEDDTGHLNLIVWQRLAERERRVLHGATLLGARGTVQRQGNVLHLVADGLEDHSGLLSGLVTRSRDFH